MTRKQDHALWFFGTLGFLLVLFWTPWPKMIRLLLTWALGPN